jgi:hypothetical protein
MRKRKRTYYGVSIGILMLETYFERFNGDIGNGRTWPFPVQYRIVKGATPDRVTDAAGPNMLDAFKAAADELIAAGVDGITTTCGFLALYQKELAAHCSVPVATSALLQVPMVAHPAARQAAGHSHVLGRGLDGGASGGCGCRSRDARVRYAASVGISAVDPARRHVGAVRHAGARGAGGGGADGACRSEHWRAGAGMHEPDAVLACDPSGDGAAGVRHGEPRALVPPQPGA